jgi:hypothetical protein
MLNAPVLIGRMVSSRFFQKGTYDQIARVARLFDTLISIMRSLLCKQVLATRVTNASP